MANGDLLLPDANLVRVRDNRRMNECIRLNSETENPNGKAVERVQFADYRSSFLPSFLTDRTEQSPFFSRHPSPASLLPAPHMTYIISFFLPPSISDPQFVADVAPSHSQPVMGADFRGSMIFSPLPGDATTASNSGNWTLLACRLGEP